MAPSESRGRALHAAAREHALRFALEARCGSRRVTRDLRQLVPKTLAAVVAWFLARLVADHQDPFFAPIAAVIALNAPLGHRGGNALRLVFGVVLGIVVGEVVFGWLGGGYGALALATFAAMALATFAGGSPTVLGQAATGAILTIVSARAQVSEHRLLDALIGAGVALVFSQLLFSPEPVALLRRAESLVLREMSIGLALTADAFEGERPEDGRALLSRAVGALGALRAGLGELDDASRASDATARRSLVWRWARREPLRVERDEAMHLELLGGSCLVLARIATLTTPPERRRLAPVLRALADTIAALARAPGAPEVRRRAAERAREIARASMPDRDMTDDSHDAAMRVAVRMIAGDVIALAPGAAPEMPEG